MAKGRGAAGADDSEKAIDLALQKLLSDAEGMDMAIQLQALNTAIKWYAVKNKVKGDDDWGSDLGKGDEQ